MATFISSEYKNQNKIRKNEEYMRASGAVSRVSNRAMSLPCGMCAVGHTSRGAPRGLQSSRGRPSLNAAPARLLGVCQCARRCSRGASRYHWQAEFVDLIDSGYRTLRGVFRGSDSIPSSKPGSGHALWNVDGRAPCIAVATSLSGSVSPQMYRCHLIVTAHLF